MAIDPRKRQKKLAKQKAKRKEKALANRRSQQGKSSSLMSAAMSLEFELAARGQVHECFVTQNLGIGGIGQAIVSRKSGSGSIAVGVYLLDTFCLGVKDAFVRLLTSQEYPAFRRQIGASSPMKPIEPSCIKKLIEGAVDYARNLGLEPHADYRMARKVIADLDSSSCTTEFTFGQNGKPHYISGPNDSEARIAQIRQALEKSCGPGGYHITIMLGDPMGDFWGDDDDWDADDEEDER
jgi:hypothetical protein